MTISASTKPKKTFNIKLERYDGSIKKATVTVHRLPTIIVWECDYFYRLGETFYEQVSGEELSDINAADTERFLHAQQEVNT